MKEVTSYQKPPFLDVVRVTHYIESPNNTLVLTDQTKNLLISEFNFGESESIDGITRNLNQAGEFKVRKIESLGILLFDNYVDQQIDLVFPENRNRTNKVAKVWFQDEDSKVDLIFTKNVVVEFNEVKVSVIPKDTVYTFMRGPTSRTDPYSAILCAGDFIDFRIDDLEKRFDLKFKFFSELNP